MSHHEGAGLRRAQISEPGSALFLSDNRRIGTPLREIRARDPRGTIKPPMNIGLADLRVGQLRGREGRDNLVGW